ncbi:MAG TPA: ATP-binding protein [Polyangia bacterium]
MSPRRALDSFLRDRLFDLVPSAIAVIDRDFNVVEANRAFEERFGAWRGRHCFEVYKGLTRRCAPCRAARTFRDGRVRTHAEVGVDRHGHTAHYVVHVAPVAGEDGTIPYLVEMSTDVTRQRELRDELSRAHVLNQALIDASGDAVLALDVRGRVTRCNPAAVALFGWTAAELRGRPAPAGLLPADFAPALRRGEPLVSVPELAARCKDGGAVPVGFCGVLLSDGDTLLGSAAFFHDLREVKQLEHEKLDAERLAAVGQTVAGLAHGVKNIMTGLEGGLYLMRSGLDRGRDQRVREGFEMLSRNIARVSSFVRSLLDFSRGRAPVVRLVDPIGLAEETVALFRDAAAREGVSVRVEAGAAMAPAAFDPEGLHESLANLVTNAIDACRTSDRAERRVVLAVHEEPDPYPFRVKPPVTPTAIVFEVRDDGAGMDYEVKQKVFTNFFTTKGEGGTGLGLLLTRRIVHEHGGTITVDSEPGAGTTFRLVFPRRRLPRAPGAERGA